jgi:16S rRNA (adenine1518-N6/adenine1519-N6)-dimethyltransferase
MPAPQPVRRKALGQHHLVSGALCRPLVEFLAPLAGARVVEVGSGGGVLTRELLAAGARVWAWELDPAWAFALPREPRLQLVVGDALEIPWARLPAPTLAAGNLPYNAATAILARLLAEGVGVPRAAVLVQLEVAQRLVAQVGDDAYGALSVLTAARAEAHLLGRVRPGSFRPPPKVDSAFVGLVRRAVPVAPERMGELERLVHAAFAQRRKTLRNALGAAWGKAQAERALVAAEIDPGARAEQIALEGFVRLLGVRQREQVTER